MVRLGGKSTNATKCLSLREQTTSYRRRKNSWGLINNLKDQANDLEQTLQRAITNYRDHGISKTEILEYLEFPPEDPAFHEAFSIPEEATDGMVKVGKKGKAVNPFYLLNRWMSGHDAGMFRRESPGASKVWKMPVSNRHESVVRWKAAILQERASKICSSMKDFNNRTEQLDTLFNEKYAAIIKDKRIIGCTTTAAAKYSREVQIASPDIILVEEAGEILESHVITAMGPETKQLVLIGDHKQLRPKVNNYDLSVEKGQGYDLNRSLFERLVLRGSSLCTLSEQHRMCPEISSLVRHLTYPDLQDAKGTLNRPSLRGFQDKIVFVNHDHPEDDVSEVADRRDGGSTTSKRNQFEVDMVLKCVRYLGQQGYGTDKIVLLTPYLGQLHLLRETLGKDHDPILNDLDSYDLVRAGLLPAATANLSKRPIRISTIGTESHRVLSALKYL